MTLQVGRFTPYEQFAANPVTRASEPVPPRFSQPDAPPAVAGAAYEGAIVGDVPPAPTAEARAMVDRAAERVQELILEGRELHFSHDEETNRVVIEVRDLDGNVIKTIPPSKALDIMSGAEV